MSKRKLFLLGTVFVLTMAGFVFGQAVNAALSNPGSAGDPLVTKSYIDGEVSKLQQQIDSLKEQIAGLKK